MNDRNILLIKQFTTFTAVGAVGSAFHYAVLIALVQFVHVGPLAAAAAGFVVGALVNYVLNYRITFRSAKRHREAALKFFSVAIVGLLMNTAIMGFAIAVLNLHYLVSQVIASGIILLSNFAGNRLWTFKTTRSDDDR